MKGFHPFIQMHIVAVTEMKGPVPLFPDFIPFSSPGDASGLEDSVHRKGLTFPEGSWNAYNEECAEIWGQVWDEERTSLGLGKQLTCAWHLAYAKH